VFGSYLIVVAVAAIGALVAGEAFAPFLLDRHMRSMGGGMGHAGPPGVGPSAAGPSAAMAADLAAAYRSALTQSLAWAAVVATLAAALVAWTVTRRIVAPLGALRAASRAIASGRTGGRLDTSAPGEIGDLAATFNTMAEALEQSDAIRRQLLTDLSHELRTPLSNLRGYLEALEDQVFTLDAATTAALRRQVDRMERLVADLSLLTRLEAGQVPIEVAPVDLGALIADSLAAFRARFDEKGVALSAGAAGEGPWVVADATRTAQVLENLLSNALRHTPPGGRVEVSARTVGEVVRVDVLDTGPGVPAAQREAVFRRLVRGDPARSTSDGEGSGIGLTIAKGLVTRQGGEIGVGDAEGGGADFYFTLPRRR
jgi:two-component system, OmpR family, sensor histidine kinase BaeS